VSKKAFLLFVVSGVYIISVILSDGTHVSEFLVSHLSYNCGSYSVFS
jgi:hypothetical protein